MRIRINRAPNSKLKVIPSIPGHRVGLIEGANGIGKSLAVQLLELITGGQPWDDDRLWVSLREALMSAEVVISVGGLSSGRSLKARLTPETWPDVPPQSADESIARIEVDDEEATIAEAGDLLRVVRFSATEDLGEVARQEVRREALKVRFLTQGVVPIFDALREQSGAIAEILRDAEPSEQEAVESRISDSEKAVTAAESRLDDLMREGDEIGHALGISRALEAGDQLSGGSKNQLAELRQAIEKNEAEVASVDKELGKVLKSLAKGGDAESQLGAAEKTHRSRLKTLGKREGSLDELQTRLDIDGVLDEEKVEALEVEVKEALRRFEAERRGLGAGTRLLTVIDEIAPPIDAVIDEGLGDQVLLSVDDVDITATELRAALRVREEHIAESQPSLRAIELDNEIAATARRLGDIKELRKAVKAAKRAADNLAESEKEVADAREAVSKAKGDLDQYDSLTKRRNTAIDEIRKAAEREAELRRELGLPQARSPEDMKRELSDVLANWGLSEGDLLARFRELEQAVPEARTALEASRQDLDAAKRDRDQARSRVRFALRQIQSDPDLRGVHKVMGDLASEGDGAAAALQSLAVRARSMTDALDAGVTDLESIRDLLDQASGQPSLSSGDPPSLETLKGAIFGTLDARLRERLSAQPIRDALFDGQELESVSLQERTVTWGHNGSKTTRPIESFSTGEQAFAFTQARVLALEKPPANQDRLLVLDEFGAFVAANRRGQLAQFLDSQKVRERASQVIVILPLRANYEKELDETKGKLRELYEKRIEQIEKQGYISEPFKAEGAST